MSLLGRFSFSQGRQNRFEEITNGLGLPSLTRVVKVGNLSVSGGLVYDGWMRVAGSKRKTRVAVKELQAVMRMEHGAIQVFHPIVARSKI